MMAHFKDHKQRSSVRPLPFLSTEKWVRQALEEDLSLGDVTTELCVASESEGEAVVVCKDPYFVVAGYEVFEQVFHTLDPYINIKRELEEGGSYGDMASSESSSYVLARLQGKIRALLSAERVALNIFARSCGIATETRRLVQALKGQKVELLDTRKNTPGMKVLEKYAARVGGARNHRFHLGDGVLIKENHIRAAGSLSEAVRRVVKGGVPVLLKVEVEVSSFEELKEALSQEGVERILCDNMSVRELKKCVEEAGGRIPLEASGNITCENIYEVACSGVEGISTSSMFRAPPVDLSFLLEKKL